MTAETAELLQHGDTSAPSVPTSRSASTSSGDIEMKDAEQTRGIALPGSEGPEATNQTTPRAKGKKKATEVNLPSRELLLVPPTLAGK